MRQFIKRDTNARHHYTQLAFWYNPKTGKQAAGYHAWNHPNVMEKTRLLKTGWIRPLIFTSLKDEKNRTMRVPFIPPHHELNGNLVLVRFAATASRTEFSTVALYLYYLTQVKQCHKPDLGWQQQRILKSMETGLLSRWWYDGYDQFWYLPVQRSR